MSTLDDRKLSLRMQELSGGNSSSTKDVLGRLGAQGGNGGSTHRPRSESEMRTHPNMG